MKIGSEYSCPFQTDMAKNVVRALEEQHQLPATTETTFLLAPRVQKHSISFLGGLSREVCYDDMTQASQVIPQIAFLEGIEDTSTFALYETDGVVDIQVPGSVNLQNRICDCQQTGKRFIIKKRLFRANENYFDDPSHLYLAFVQSKLLFLNSIYPIPEEKAVELCGLLICENSESSNVNWENDDFSYAVKANLPLKVKCHFLS